MDGALHIQSGNSLSYAGPPPVLIAGDSAAALRRAAGTVEASPRRRRRGHHPRDDPRAAAARPIFPRRPVRRSGLGHAARPDGGRLEKNRVAVSSLCIAAAVPATTALRWIKALTDRGLFVRAADPEDGRRVFIELSDEAARALAAYLRALQRHRPGRV